MNAVVVARKLVARYGMAEAKRLVFARLLHWNLSFHRVDGPALFIHKSFWERTAQALPRWA